MKINICELVSNILCSLIGICLSIAYLRMGGIMGNVMSHEVANKIIPLMPKILMIISMTTLFLIFIKIIMYSYISRATMIKMVWTSLLCIGGGLSNIYVEVLKRNFNNFENDIIALSIIVSSLMFVNVLISFKEIYD